MRRDPLTPWKSCFLYGFKMSTYTVGGASLIGIPLVWWLQYSAGVPLKNSDLMIKLWIGLVLVMWFLMFLNFAGQERTAPGPNAIEHMARNKFIPILVRRVEKMVANGGLELDEPFDAFTWTMKWLTDYCPALGGPPIGYINSAEGRARVFQIIEQMESGAYA